MIWLKSTPMKIKAPRISIESEGGSRENKKVYPAMMRVLIRKIRKRYMRFGEVRIKTPLRDNTIIKNQVAKVIFFLNGS